VSDCLICKDEGWVCQVHETAWEGGNAECCGAPGKPCKCNPLAHHGFKEVIAETDEQRTEH
jgi:hypothetical protein